MSLENLMVPPGRTSPVLEKGVDCIIQWMRSHCSFLSQGDAVIHSFNKHFLGACYVPGLMPGAEDREEGQRTRRPRRAPG